MGNRTVVTVPVQEGEEIRLSVDPETREVSVMGAAVVEVTVPFWTVFGSAAPNDHFDVRTTVGARDGELTVAILRPGGPWWPRFEEPRLVVFTDHHEGREGINVRSLGGLEKDYRDIGRRPLRIPELTAADLSPFRATETH